MIIDKLNSFLAILNHPMNKSKKFNTIGKILWWKVNQLFFHLPAIVTFNNNKMQFICPPASSYGSLVVYCNLPEYPEMVFLEKILKSNSIFIDVGANIGVYTILAAAKIKKGKIYSFEPIPSVLNILYQNIRINNANDRVKVIEKVVSDKNGNEKFVIQDISEYSHISSNQTSKSVLMPSVKLDDFCDKEKISFIDVVKIDVEGEELKVLRGLENYLKSGKVGVLIIEFNSNQVIDYLKKFKYTVFKINKKLDLEEIKKDDQSVNLVAFLKKDLVDIEKNLKTSTF
ncbi:MAG: FkbM family methyltransferase [Candidatus Daviesbacteria bacterium]|nr:FkbM family methyltransferase [Candidatus Daviesbacteria bacterium]